MTATRNNSNDDNSTSEINRRLAAKNREIIGIETKAKGTAYTVGGISTLGTLAVGLAAGSIPTGILALQTVLFAGGTASSMYGIFKRKEGERIIEQARNSASNLSSR